MVDASDGLHLSWPDRREWVHVRASGTEPILRIIAEAPDGRRAAALADWAMAGLAGADGGVEREPTES